MAHKAAEAKHAEIERKMAEKAEADRKAAELKQAQAQGGKKKAALEAKRSRRNATNRRGKTHRSR